MNERLYWMAAAPFEASHHVDIPSRGHRGGVDHIVPSEGEV